MGALEYLKGYARDNPTGTAILSGAIACFAAVAVIGGFGIDLQSKIPSVIYLVAIGIVFYLLVSLLSEPVARRAAGGFVTFIIVGWIAAFFWSRLNPKEGALACAVYFWTPCVVTADAIAAETAPKPDLKAPPPGDLTSDQKSKYRVFIQFAGYDRGTIISLADSLSKQGWNIQGGNRGGERIGSAAGLSEVRYLDASTKTAAEALAAALTASKVSSKPVKAVQLDVIKPNTLEVWIGQ